MTLASEMSLLLTSIIVVGTAMAALGVGALVSNRCLRGSCNAVDTAGEALSCDTCPRRTRASS